MTCRRYILALLVLGLAMPAAAQQTPTSVVAAYDALANGILALNHAEEQIVRAILTSHRDAANALAGKGEWEKAAAEIALFASEGDNAVGGIRKRLLEGGHHHNAASEEAGTFEPGYVLVTRQAKQRGLAIASALRQAKTGEERSKAWSDFAALVKEVLGGE
jgi:hypothetical protein